MQWRDLILFLCAGLAAAEIPPGGESAGRDLRLTVGESTVVDCSFDIARISTTVPEVVDTVALSRREVLLLAKG
jgi:hypothetical protein